MTKEEAKQRQAELKKERDKIIAEEIKLAEIIDNPDTYQDVESFLFDPNHRLSMFITNATMEHQLEKEVEQTNLYIRWKNIAEYVERKAGNDGRFIPKQYNKKYFVIYDNKDSLFEITDNVYNEGYSVESISFSSFDIAQEALEIFGEHNFKKMVGTNGNK